MSLNRQLNKKRILLVDDHPVVREGLAESINREGDLMVCAEADDRRHEAAGLHHRPKVGSAGLEQGCERHPGVRSSAG